MFVTGAEPRRGIPRAGTWVEPEPVAQIAFMEWTRDGRLRHPSFLGLRFDKPAREVSAREPSPEHGSAAARTKRGEARLLLRSSAAGVSRVVAETLACHTEAVAARRVRPSATSPLPGMELASDGGAAVFPPMQERGASRSRAGGRLLLVRRGSERRGIDTPASVAGRNSCLARAATDPDAKTGVWLGG
jgi:hypothetical protein